MKTRIVVPCIHFVIYFFLFVAAYGQIAQPNYDMACVERYSDASGFTSGDNVSFTCDATDGFSFLVQVPPSKPPPFLLEEHIRMAPVITRRIALEEEIGKKSIGHLATWQSFPDMVLVKIRQLHLLQISW